MVYGGLSLSWFFAFAALWTVYVSMKRGLDARFTHGKTSLTVGQLEGKDAPQPPMPREEEPEEETEV